MKRRISILLLTFLLTFLFGSLTVSAADEVFTQKTPKSVKVNINEPVSLTISGLKETDKPEWFSNNVNIAKIEKIGPNVKVGDVYESTVEIRPLRKGKTTISVRVGLERKAFTVTVMDPSVKLNKKAATLYLTLGGVMTARRSVTRKAFN